MGKKVSDVVTENTKKVATALQDAPKDVKKASTEALNAITKADPKKIVQEATGVVSGVQPQKVLEKVQDVISHTTKDTVKNLLAPFRSTPGQQSSSGGESDAASSSWLWVVLLLIAATVTGGIC